MSRKIICSIPNGKNLFCHKMKRTLSYLFIRLTDVNLRNKCHELQLLLRLCVCVCVFFPFILDIKFVGRTSRGHTEFLIHLLSAVCALIFLARRIQPFLSLVDREVEFVY